MSTDTRFYTTNAQYPFEQIVVIVADACHITPKIGLFDPGYDGHPYGAIRFDYKGEDREMWIHTDTKDFDKNVPHTLFSLGAWGCAVEIMTHIGEKVGGWLDADRRDDEPEVYIEPKETLLLTEPSNRHKLVLRLATEMAYSAATEFVELAQKWREDLEQFNFGMEEE